MLFHSPEFFILMTLTLVLFYMSSKSRIYLLALANMLFYAVTGLGYLILFVALSTITHYSSLQLQGKFRKWFLWLAVGLNVLNLAFFKYSLFLLTNIQSYIPINLVSDLVAEGSFFSNIVLPIGISFYTFQLIAYVVDVYKGKLKPTRSWLEFWVFISFFGQLIAGPIMRGKDFLPQVEKLEQIKYRTSNIKMGIAYLSLGLFKKIVLADNIAPLVDSFYSKGVALSGGEAWIAIYLFAFQIYFDFSAYSEMAVGVGYLFGLKLDLNFRTPYLSASGTEFWRRWHITLSNWIKDYIYIPLGGSRKGEVRQYVNLFIAMTISGLWHGAAWTFIAWGMFHGFLLIAHKMYSEAKDKLGIKNMINNKIYHVFTVFMFFQLTCIGWVLFRVDGIRNALVILKNMFTVNPFIIDPSLYKYVGLVVVLFALHVVEYFMRKYANQISLQWHKFFPAPIRGLVYTAFVVVLLLMLKGDQNSFIYFQF